MFMGSLSIFIEFSSFNVSNLEVSSSSGTEALLGFSAGVREGST